MPRLFRAEVVRGEPYDVGGRLLTPEARILSFTRGRGMVGRTGISGWMYCFSRVSPLAVVENTDEGARRTKVVDATASTVTSLFTVGVAMVLFFGTVRWAARRVRGRRT